VARSAILGESLWTWDAAAGEYFFHQFTAAQPDLNFRNDAVRAELIKVMRYWLDKGVDGFRLDVPYTFYEGPAGCTHQPETHAFLKEMRKVTDRYPNRAMVGEIWGTPEQVAAHYGNGADELHMVFDFDLLSRLQSLAGGTSGPADAVAMIASRKAQVPPGGQPTITLGNHDLPRYSGLANRRPQAVRALAALQLTLPGTPFVYYGEEIGLPNGSATRVDWRDMARSPMAWSNRENAGFSPVTPWIPLAPGWESLNAAAELPDESSTAKLFFDLIALRNKSPVLQDTTLLSAGDFVISGQALGFYRRAPAGTWFVGHNFDTASKTLLVGDPALRHIRWRSGAATASANGTGVTLTLDPGVSAILAAE
jgi:alpha-glucosidase